MASTVYRRSPFRFYGTYVTLGFMAFAYFIYTPQAPALMMFFVVVIIGLAIYGFGIQQYHFELTDDALVVGNHWFFWIHKRLPYGEMESVYFEGEVISRSSKGMSFEAGIFIRTGGKRYTFRAGNLPEQEVRQLVADVQARAEALRHTKRKKSKK